MRAAIVNPRVIQAIRLGALSKIAISLVEWSGVRQQEIVIDWTVIRGEATARDFSAQIIQDRTSISGGIDFGMAQLARAEGDQNDACEDEMNALFEFLTTEPAICPTA